MGIKKNNFNALTPKIMNKSKQIYTEALDYAFSNNDIKNIAITGIYGAGKSTVWKTYVQERNIKEIITVSIGKYEVDSKASINGEDSLNEENRIEKQLINQMLSQIKSSKIPLSKYKFKENLTNCKLLFRVVMTLSFVISVLLWLFKDTLSVALREVFQALDNNNIIYISGLMFLLPIAVFLFNFYKENRIKLSKINFKGAEASFRDEDDETILDRDIKEIVYLLNSSRANVIVFEDLDRYDNIKIFTKLRELNFLLNSFINVCDQDRIVRFIYMVKDGLFDDKNRTKFFDFILPIVPVVDSKTSENKLIDLLEGVDNVPDRRLLANISLYIDDMRLLKNIVNEYIIYSKVIPLEKIGLESNKLFSLITLKNIFPNEFDFLQEDKGYIRSVFDELNKIRETLKADFESKLVIVKEQIEFINSRLENDKYEAMSLMIPASIKLYNHDDKPWHKILKEWHDSKEKTYSINYSSGTSNYNYDQFVERFILTTKERKSLIERMPEDREFALNKLKSESEKLGKQIQNIENYSFKELISNMNYNQKEELFKSEKYDITNNHYFSLVRFLIVEGLLDETYWYYKGNFDVDTSKTLKRNDIIYMKSLIEGKKIDVFLDVETPSEIINRLDLHDFSRFNILNKIILKYCLDNNLVDYMFAIIESVYNNDNFEDLVKIIEGFKLETTEKFVSMILENDINFLLNIILACDEDGANAFKNILISLLTNTSINFDELDLLRPYIEENEYLISLIPEDKFKIFIRNISSAYIKFISISEVEIETEKLKEIEKIQAYTLNIRNVLYIAENILEKKIFFGNLLNEIYQSPLLTSSKLYIEDDFEYFVTQYIKENSKDEAYTNNEEIFIKILTSDISDELKIKYINKNEIVVTNVNDLKGITNNEEALTYLFNGDKIKFNKENVFSGWKMVGTCNNEFANYVDRNINKDNVQDILGNNREMCNFLINDENISDRLFGFVLEYANKPIGHINSNLPEMRVSLLIKSKLVKETDLNIKVLVENSYNEELVMLANSDNQVVEDDIIEMLLVYELSDNLIYMLVNSNISDINAVKLINHIKKDVLIERVDASKDNVIKNIINSGLSNDNIEYICHHFDDFYLKKDFILYLDKNNKLENLSVELLNKQIMLYVLRDQNIAITTKVNLIMKMIETKTNDEDIKVYISSLDEIADLANVWNKKYPSLDNVYKEKIGQALINAKYVKLRKGNDNDYDRIMLFKQYQ